MNQENPSNPAEPSRPPMRRPAPDRAPMPTRATANPANTPNRAPMPNRAPAPGSFPAASAGGQQCLKCRCVNTPGAEQCAQCHSILFEQAKYMAKELAGQNHQENNSSSQTGLYLSLAFVAVSLMFGGYMVFLRPAPTPAPGAPPTQSSANPANPANPANSAQQAAERAAQPTYVPTIDPKAFVPPPIVNPTFVPPPGVSKGPDCTWVSQNGGAPALKCRK
jgi:hypothetical protein